MARSISSVLIVMAFIGVCKATFQISEFESISNNVGVLDDWVSLDPRISPNATEDFGLIYGKDKLYLVNRRNGTAVRGGIVSTLVNGTWKHTRFDDKLDEDRFQDELFTLAGRLFMLTAGEMDGRIAVNKLFAWDDETSKWAAVNLDIPDKDKLSQQLNRGPRRIDVPDHEGKIAYVVTTDHDFDSNHSTTTFSKLEVTFDDMSSSSKPLNASFKFINRVKSDEYKAVLASALEHDRLYAVVATFVMDAITGRVSITAKISVDYAVDMANNNSIVDGIKLDNDSMPEVDFIVGKDRIFQVENSLLFIGPPHPKISQDSTPSSEKKQYTHRSPSNLMILTKGICRCSNQSVSQEKKSPRNFCAMLLQIH